MVLSQDGEESDAFVNFKIGPDDPFESHLFRDGKPLFRLVWTADFRGDDSPPMLKPIPLLIPIRGKEVSGRISLARETRMVPKYEIRDFDLSDPEGKDRADYKELKNRIAAQWYLPDKEVDLGNRVLQVSWFRRYRYLRLNDYNDPSLFQIHGSMPPGRSNRYGMPLRPARLPRR